MNAEKTVQDAISASIQDDKVVHLDYDVVVATNRLTGASIRFRTFQHAFRNLLHKWAAGPAGAGWSVDGLSVDRYQDREEMRAGLQACTPRIKEGYVPAVYEGNSGERRWGVIFLVPGEPFTDIIDSGLTWEEADRTARRLNEEQ